MDFTALFTKILMFLLLITAGYFFSKKGMLTPEFNKCASKLLINLFVPATILNSVMSNRVEMSGKELWTTLALLTLATVISYVIGFIYAKFLKEDDERRTLKEMLMSVTNTLFVGMPILAAAFGSVTNFYIGISCIPFNIILFSYGVSRLNKGKGTTSIKSMINTCLIVAVVSLFIFLFNPKVPQPVTDILGTVGSATTPLSMVLIGSTMGRNNPVSELKSSETWIYLLIKLIVSPLVAYCITKCFTDNTYLIATCTVIAGCPVAIMLTALSIQYDQDPEYTSKMITISTLLSIIVLPVLLYVMF